MKRLLVLMMILALPLAAHAADASKEIPVVRISTLISEYRGNDGFEVVRLGGLTAMLARSIFTTSVLSDMGEEAAVLGKMINGIRKIAVVDYEDASPAVRAEFSVRVEKALEGTEVILEAKDEGSTIRMYGKVSGDGDQLKDFVFFCPEDCALIMLKGTISTDIIAGLTQL